MLFLISLSVHFRATWETAWFTSRTLHVWDKSLAFPHSRAEVPNLCKFKIEEYRKDLKLLPLQAVPEVLPQLGSNPVIWQLDRSLCKNKRTSVSVHLQYKWLWRTQPLIQSLHVGACMNKHTHAQASVCGLLRLCLTKQCLLLYTLNILKLFGRV